MMGDLAQNNRWYRVRYFATMEVASSYSRIIMKYRSAPDPGSGECYLDGWDFHYDPRFSDADLVRMMVLMAHLYYGEYSDRRQELIPRVWDEAALIEAVAAWDPVMNNEALQRRIPGLDAGWPQGIDLREKHGITERAPAEKIYNDILDHFAGQPQPGGAPPQQQPEQQPEPSPSEKQQEQGDGAGNSEDTQPQSQSTPGEEEGPDEGDGAPDDGPGGDQEQPDTQQGPANDGNGSQGDQPPQSQRTNDKQRGGAQGAPGDEPGQDAPGDGSGQAQQPPGAHQPGPQGQKKDAPSPTGPLRLDKTRFSDDREEYEELKRETEELAAGLQPGSAEGGAVRRFAVQKSRPLSWKDDLRLFVSPRGMEDFSLFPRPKEVIPGQYLTRLQVGKPRIGIVVDSSGSLDKKLLNEAFEICAGAMRQGSQPLVAAGDTKLHYPAPGQTGRWLELLARHEEQKLGGGGTDMGKVAWEAYFRLRRPDRVLVVTDGLSPWPSSTHPVVVNGGRYERMPPNTRIVVMGPHVARALAAMPDYIRRITRVAEPEREQHEL